jgi:hypothetical protein
MINKLICLQVGLYEDDVWKAKVKIETLGYKLILATGQAVFIDKMWPI